MLLHTIHRLIVCVYVNDIVNGLRHLKRNRLRQNIDIDSFCIFVA